METLLSSWNTDQSQSFWNELWYTPSFSPQKEREAASLHFGVQGVLTGQSFVLTQGVRFNLP